MDKATTQQKEMGIRDIAKYCNVSTTTVSHAFSGKRPVSKKLKESIFHVAKELDYQPNLWARNLLKGGTKIIGLIIHDFGNNPINSLSVEQYEENAHRLGYQLWISVTNEDPERTKQAIANCRGMRVDGLILASRMILHEQIRQLVSLGISVATPSMSVEGCDTNPGNIQNSDGIKQVVQYLHSIGHRKTAFLAGFEEELTNQQRLSAYKTYVRALGMEVNEDLIIQSLPDDSEDEQVEKLLAKSRDFTALICFNDHIAFNAMKVLKRHGLRIPDDISLTGFDDLPWCEMCSPPLTSVRADINYLAKTTVEQLVANIQQGRKIKPQKVETRLIVRGSCSRIKNTN